MVALIPLLFYAFVRASYEEYRIAAELRGGSDMAGTVPQLRPNYEFEQLEKQLRKTDLKLRRTEQELDRYRAIFSDPSAKRQRDEKIARERCVEVAYQLFTFLKNRPYSDHAETVAAFKQRQQWKVDEVRGRMDELDLLTPLEQKILTFQPGDQLDKIELMVELLRKIGAEG